MRLNHNFCIKNKFTIDANSYTDLHGGILILGDFLVYGLDG